MDGQQPVVHSGNLKPRARHAVPPALNLTKGGARQHGCANARGETRIQFFCKTREHTAKGSSIWLYLIFEQRLRWKLQLLVHEREGLLQNEKMAEVPPAVCEKDKKKKRQP